MYFTSGLNRALRFLAGAFCLTFAVASCQAGTVTPSGLGPTDSFRLVFVSSATTDASTRGNAYYDNFVNTLAVSAGWDTVNGQSVTWRGLMSSYEPGGPEPNANDKLASSSIPIYLVDGTKISNGDIWYGTLLHALNLTELSSTVSTTVWTGSYPAGDGVTCQDLGVGCTTISVYGNSNATNGDWMTLGNGQQSVGRSVYAFSSVIEGSATPEPGSLFLLGGGMVALYFRARKRA